MKVYQAAQQKYKTDIKKKVTRQVQIVKPDATDEEIDAVMRSEGGRDALYQERILAGGINDQIKTSYAKVAGKYQDVLALEQSIAELHQMFLDFALLTEQQGELLDQIEFQVKQAADYVEDANVDVYESIEYQRKIRKKQCWIMAIVVVCIVVILFATILWASLGCLYASCHRRGSHKRLGALVKENIGTIQTYRLSFRKFTIAILKIGLSALVRQWGRFYTSE